MLDFLTLDKGNNMLKFESQDEIEVYAGLTGFICFKASGDVIGSEESVVMLSIGQFRKVIKNAEKLITLAEENKILHEAENE
jgi:hypothetical protein